MMNIEKEAKIGIDIMDVLYKANTSIGDALAILQTTYCFAVKQALLEYTDEDIHKCILNGVKSMLDKTYLNCEDISKKLNKKR